MKYLVLDFLEETAARFPDKTAFSDPKKSISFSQLVCGAKRAATHILPYVKARETVCFYLDKSVDAIVGFLGAVYAGCAYAQINLRYPAARASSIFDVLGTPVVITDREHVEQLKMTGYSGTVLFMEELCSGEPDECALKPVRSAMLDIDPLYVNFTSGSTGMPKGVAVAHRSVVDFIQCFTELFQITEQDVLANQAPFDFDVSVKDIYSGLFTGARVCIIPTPYFSIPTVLMDYLDENQVTVLVWAVSALCFLTTMNALAYRCPKTIRMILFSGEVMPIKHLKKLQKYLPDSVYVNLYGPTEITCNCTYYIVDREFEVGDVLPLGLPFPNERVFLLDSENRMVTGCDEIGELCVAGTAVALGYYADRERTSAAFCQNPLNSAWPEMIYRTGDLVKYNERGEMVYVSRKDFQIKHMGHRIELGEIENALCAVEGVERACCGYWKEKGKIVAFVCGSAQKEQILAALREILPNYMIPNVLQQIESMPLNKNGKIDRNQLMEQYMKKGGAKRG